MKLKHALFVSVVGAVCIFFCYTAEPTEVAIRPVMALNGMVTSAHPIASQVGLDILKRGGNAFDAAAAVAAVLGVVEPGSSGIDGEGFGLLYLAKTKEVKALNWTTRTPVSPEFVTRRKEILDPYNPIVASPPGTLAGLVELLAKHGTMSLAEVLAPAIRYAEQGVVVSELLHDALVRMRKIFLRDPATSKIFLVNGEAPPVGYVLPNPDLAKTLRTVAAKGKDALYKGEIAAEIVRFFRETGGLITEKDLELASKPEWLTPIRTTYRGYTVYAVPLNSGGPCLLESLNILEGIDVGLLSEDKRIHTEAETFKLVIKDRDTYLGDPAFIKVPLNDFISKDFASQRRALIKQDSLLPWSVPPGQIEKGTTHFVVADGQGNVISVTNTHDGWGFGRVVGHTGMFFCDGIKFMSLDPKHPNFAEPGKRMRKNLSPALVFDTNGNLVLAIGAAGGTTIWQTVTQSIVNVLDVKLNVQQAIAAPRVAYAAPGAKLSIDSHFRPEVLEALRSLGYQVQGDAQGESVGAVQGIAFDPKTHAMSGGADPRREGKPAGY